ncbi:MAG: formyltetrahydrofolate deformylase [Janthinobacterium lividum]
MAAASTFILTLACPDRPGIVHAVSGFLYERGANIVDSAQFGDADTGEFFMRVQFQYGAPDAELALRRAFASLGERFAMRWELHDAATRPRVMIMVSKIGHCLNDLLFRHRTGQLPIDIPAIVSNHADFKDLAASYEIPFHYFPIDGKNGGMSKGEQEARIMQLVRDERIDLTILARYMQILSPVLCAELAGRAINIHHSFLPSFKGAKPYHQAFDRGVKLIGATAHYVTTDLDEGPIIEQEVERVNHGMSPAQLTAIGQDVECVTLARAVKWHVEHRVLIDGHKTVVFA